MVLDFIREHKPLVIAVVLTLIVAGICFANVSAWQSAEADAKRQNEDMTAQLEMKTQQATNAEHAALVAATGVNMDRVNADSEKIKDMFSRALTWDSFETYKQARAVFVDEFGISEDSWLLKEFMPKIEEHANKYGRMVNEIDEGHYNLKFFESDVRCIGFNGDTYNYLVYFTCSSDFRGAQGTSAGIAMLTIDKDGKVTSADAMEVSQ